jgi:hypothetical protein
MASIAITHITESTVTSDVLTTEEAEALHQSLLAMYDRLTDQMVNAPTGSKEMQRRYATLSNHRSAVVKVLRKLGLDMSADVIEPSPSK